MALGGIPLVLTDTAGLRETDEPVERIGVGRSHALIAAADVVVWLGEPVDAPAHPRLIGVHAKCDLDERSIAPLGALTASAVTGVGMTALLEQVRQMAAALLPAEDAIALNRRQATHLDEVSEALSRAAAGEDVVTVAEDLRVARHAFDRLTGRASIENVMDALFSRFCLGK